MPKLMPTEYTIRQIFKKRSTDTIYIKQIYDEFLEGTEYTEQQVKCVKHRTRVIIERMRRHKIIKRIGQGVYLAVHHYLEKDPRTIKTACVRCYKTYTNKIDDHERSVTCPNCCFERWL